MKTKSSFFKDYKIKFLYGIIGILIFLLIASLEGGRRQVSAVTGSYENLKNLAEVLSLVELNYVDEVDSEELIEGAIKGMLGKLDPHTSYLTREMYKEMQVNTEGEFGGLGIEITIREGWLTVVSPLEDTPAYKAGIKAGDKIIKISGESTKDITLSEAVRKMRGLKGTKITITVMREEFEEPKDFEITRAVIKIKYVKNKILDGNIGYIKIKGFSKSTAPDLEKTLEKFKKKKVTKYILDLRNNPGGLLNQAVAVAEKFLPEGKLVVYTKGKNQGQSITYKTDEKNTLSSYPLIVLVNGGSASASEIVAGALQDLKRAIILGTLTFGKGSVQTIIPLSDGSALRLTTARYYTPSGRVIQNKGITPDIIVENKLTDSGNKTPAAKIHRIREKDLKRHLDGGKENSNQNNPDNEEISSQNSEKIAKDAQLYRAVSLLKSWDVFQKTTLGNKK